VANLFRFQRILAYLFALSVPAAFAAVYLDGKAIDADVFIKSKSGPVEPPPVEPPEPPPVTPPTNCPATQVPIAGTIDLDNPGPQQFVDPRPWVAFKLNTGTDITGQFSFGNYQGSDSVLKTAAVTTCPIISNDYLVTTCYASGSSTVNLGFSPGSRCSLKRGETYYLMYGAKACGSASCRSVMRIY
jgi:hypothetical protein